MPAEPYVGDIQAVGFNFAPRGWAMCQGQLMPISQNTALFSLLGTQFGGNGTTTFALPDLRGRVPVGQGTGPGLTQRVMGEEAGETTVTLLTTEMPAHTHAVGAASGDADSNSPSQAVYAAPNVNSRLQGMFGTTSDTAFAGSTQVTGGSQPHNNMQPYLGLNFVIALEGLFPPR